MAVTDPSATPGVRRLRAIAVGASLGRPAPLADVVDRLGFVQYDPIRRPARAQDLILHQRVSGYHCGDLDRRYGELGLEEDTIYAYGAMPRAVARMLHPRYDVARPGRSYRPDGLSREVLALLREGGQMQLREVAARFGRRRAANDWGGFSAATTRALEELHHYGLVRVARRDGGTRVYESRERPRQSLRPGERLRGLTVLIARILAPVSERSLRATLAKVERASGRLPGREAVVAGLLHTGELEGDTVDGTRYLWPADLGPPGPADEAPRVRFLAPFDPVVWDRRRFEHLWGWTYRLEAYTPSKRRQLGYYALPVLWADRAVGWINYEAREGSWSMEHRLVDPASDSAEFRIAFEEEASRMELMLAGSATGQPAGDLAAVDDE